MVGQQLQPAEGSSRAVLPQGCRWVVGFLLHRLQFNDEGSLLAAGAGLYFSKSIKDLEQPELLNGPESI